MTHTNKINTLNKTMRLEGHAITEYIGIACTFAASSSGYLNSEQVC